MLALILLVEDEWWQISRQCYGHSSLILSGLYVGSVVLMFLHHAVQPRAGYESWRQHSLIVRLTSQGILSLFVSLLGAWFVLGQFAFLVAAKQSEFPEDLIVTVQRNIGLPAYALFLSAVAVTVYRLSGTPRRPTRINLP